MKKSPIKNLCHLRNLRDKNSDEKIQNKNPHNKKNNKKRCKIIIP